MSIPVLCRVESVVKMLIKLKPAEYTRNLLRLFSWDFLQKGITTGNLSEIKSRVDGVCLEKKNQLAVALNLSFDWWQRRGESKKMQETIDSLRALPEDQDHLRTEIRFLSDLARAIENLNKV